MTWVPKPRNWRRYYGYRPPSLAAPPMTDGQIKDQASAYLVWLAGARGWDLDRAAAYVAGSRPIPPMAPALREVELV